MEDYERRAGIVAKCVGLYPKTGQATVFLYDTTDLSQAETNKLNAYDPSATKRPVDGLGDVSVELTKDQEPPGNADSPVRYSIGFTRGCYTVFVNAGGALGANYIVDASGVPEWNARRDWVRATAASIDAQLKGNPCPGGAATTTTPPVPPGELGVTINCQTNNDPPDLVKCTAEPSGQKPDASLTYTWTFDGAAQSATGTELTVTGVQPGDHTASVVATDSVNQLTSAPATTSFGKQSPTSTPPAGGGSDDLPLIPIIAIGTVATAGTVGGIAWWLGRRGRGQPLGAPPRAMPPQATPPPPVPPERVVLPRPATPPERLAPPPPPSRPAAPPEKAKAQPPAAAPAPPQQDHRDGEVWLEAGQSEIRVLGDGRSEVVVTVIARQRSGAIVIDASGEVTPSRTVSDPKKVQLTQRPGYCAFGVRAMHAGSLPATATITINGISSLGRPVRPATVTVVIDPVAIDVRIKVWKRGFLEQEVVATLATVTNEVRATVVSLTISERLPEPVNQAHCTASLRVGNGAWSAPVEVRSKKDGTFWFGLPPRLVQAYGGSGAYPLPKPVELSFDEEVKRAMTRYGEVFIEFSRDLDAHPGGAYNALKEELRDYRDELAKQLRERAEEDHDRALSAIHLLQAAIAFALKYRRDVHAQRRVVDLTAQEALSSILDVLTDFLPIANIVFKWVSRLGNKAIQIGGGLLAKIAVSIRSIPGGRLAARALLYGVRVLRAPVEVIEREVLSIIDDARRFAVDAGLSTRFIDGIRNFAEEAGRELLPGDLQREAKDAFEEALDVIGEVAQRALSGGMRLVLAVLHVVGVLIAAAAQGIVVLLKNLSWGGDSPWFSTVLERVEAAVGDAVSAIYDKFGAAVDVITRRHFSQEGVPGKDVSQKNLADMVMDQMVTLDDLDKDCMPALRLAWLTARGLDVTTEWEAAVQRVTGEERRVMNVWETREKLFYDIGFISDVIKLAVKIAQAFALTWKTTSVAVIRFASWTASKLGQLVPGLDGIVAFLNDTAAPAAEALHKRLERFIDVCDAVAVRIPILAMEVAELFVLRHTGATRIRALFDERASP